MFMHLFGQEDRKVFSLLIQAIKLSIAFNIISCFFMVKICAAEQATKFELTKVNLAEDSPIQISSDSAIYDENQGLAIFKGDVRVGYGPYKLRGEHMEVIFDASESGNKDPLQLVFTNGVIFSNGFEMGKSVIANYYIPESLLVLEKDVMFKQNETVFFGQTAEIDLESGNMIFGGRINASINTSD